LCVYISMQPKEISIDLTNLPDLFDNLKYGTGDIICSKSKKVNILLIGRSQVGKSMIIKNLCNPKYGQAVRSYSDTTNPNSYDLLLTNKQTGQLLNLTVIDTPGLYDERNKLTDIKSNDQILQLISKCVELNLTYFHMIGFVYDISRNVTPIDVEAFNLLKDYLGLKFSPISMLIFTHADSMTDERILETINELKTGDKTKNMFEYCKLSYQFLGSLNKDLIQTLGDKDMSVVFCDKTLQRLEKMRTNFATELFKLDKYIYIDEIEHIVREKRTKIEKIEAEAMKRAKNCIIQ